MQGDQPMKGGKRRRSGASKLNTAKDKRDRRGFGNLAGHTKKRRPRA